jgi:FKBP-type peptidyl-prolyl cis-trans isomerase
MAAQLQALEMTPAQKTAMVRGITMAINGTDLPYDPQQVQQQLQEFMGKRQASFLSKIKAAQVAAGTELFAKLKDNKNVVITPSGLGYEIVQAGKGAVAKPGQLVTINYTGALATGQVFDSNEGRGPAEFLLQQATEQSPQGVIAGMFEGLQKTGIGGKLKLYIPAALGYGDQGAPGAIPPGAALVFDVEIVGAKDAPKDAGK